jgi:hypothetical protein
MKQDNFQNQSKREKNVTGIEMQNFARYLAP